MDRNVGVFDRVLRLVLGCGLIGFAWFYPNIPWSPLGWIGVVPLVTALVGTCPLYSLLGLSTCKTNFPTSGAN